MNPTALLRHALTLALCFCLFAGCGDGAKTADKPNSDTHADDHGHDHGPGGHSHDHDHDHAHNAPHGGFLFDIGREHTFHGEIVDDHDTDIVTIHILDGDLKPSASDQPSVELTLSAGDKSETFKFKQSETEPSQYMLKDDAMMALLDTKGVKGKLRLTMEDKPFTGSFSYAPPHAH